jgi:hypothetical protein
MAFAPQAPAGNPCVRGPVALPALVSPPAQKARPVISRAVLRLFVGFCASATAANIPFLCSNRFTSAFRFGFKPRR